MGYLRISGGDHLPCKYGVYTLSMDFCCGEYGGIWPLPRHCVRIEPHRSIYRMFIFVTDVLGGPRRCFSREIKLPPPSEFRSVGVVLLPCSGWGAGVTK